MTKSEIRKMVANKIETFKAVYLADGIKYETARNRFMGYLMAFRDLGIMDARDYAECLEWFRKELLPYTVR